MSADRRESSPPREWECRRRGRRESGCERPQLAEATQREGGCLLSRRDVLRWGLAGLAACWVSELSAWWWGPSVTDATQDYPGIFKKDAPDEATFREWQRRGWLREAMHYQRRDSASVQCGICPNRCVLAPGDRSHCRTRINREGTLYTLAYSNPCSFHIDPVEKKPLYHFLPGSRAFSLAIAGCVLRCMNCQNWEISQKKPEETKRAEGPPLRLAPHETLTVASIEDLARLTMTPDDVVALAGASRCASIAYTYSEPIAWYEYTYDTAAVARRAGVKNVFVTSGYIRPEPLRELARFLDAAHVDLKGFDEATYMKLNAGHLQPVLDAIRTLKECGVWIEIVNLVVPTYTDHVPTIRRMCDWIAREIGPDVPVHFSRFHPAHRLTHLPPTPLETLLEAREQARQAGLRYVYLGNVTEVPDAGTTFCPSCKKPVIQRDLFAVTAMNLKDGHCANCGTPIPGVWNT